MTAIRSRRMGIFVTVAVLTGVLIFSAAAIYAVHRDREHYRIQLENIYKKAFYELSDNMNNLDVKMSKLMVASSSSESLRYLNEVSRQTDTTAASLSQLPITENTIEKTSKFINQLGDFCKGLSNKVAAGKTISEPESQQIENLYDTGSELRKQVTILAGKVAEGYSFSKSIRGGYGDELLKDSFTQIEQGTVEYPSLIYDGPFSDSLQNAQPKGLPENEVGQEEAQSALEGYLKDFDVQGISYQNSSDGKMFSYNFNVNTAGGQLFAQVSKMGGKLLLIDNMRDLDNVELEVDECIDIAESFVAALGIENAQAVWQSDYHGYVYVNIAAVQDNVVLYPDLIKVIVARDNGEIIGYEARGYYTNHTERQLPSPALNTMQARQKTFSRLTVDSERLTLIPLETGEERLAYEFFGNYRDLTYFVYIDALTGEEINVLRVIDSEDGSLVI